MGRRPHRNRGPKNCLNPNPHHPGGARGHPMNTNEHEKRLTWGGGRMVSSDKDRSVIWTVVLGVTICGRTTISAALNKCRRERPCSLCQSQASRSRVEEMWREGKSRPLLYATRRGRVPQQKSFPRQRPDVRATTHATRWQRLSCSEREPHGNKLRYGF